MTFIAALILVAATAAMDVSLSPNPPVAGQTLTITTDAALLNVSSPMGRWRQSKSVDSGTATLELPAGLPLLLVAKVNADGLDEPHAAYTVVTADGKESPRSSFWLGYLNAGFPSPYPLDGADTDEAARYATEAVRLAPDDPVARELLWRIEAQKATDAAARTALLQRIDAELGQRPNGRLAIAAAAIHAMLGDTAGAQAVERTHKEIIDTARSAEEERWTAVGAATSPARRIELIHDWLAEDPFSSFVPSLVQILAPSYLAAEGYRSTAVFGLMSLRLMPEDAMTLNGVAFAMAEGGFQFERGLVLANRAVSILDTPGALRRPEGMSDQRWRAVLNEARAATLDTRGWLQTKLGRFDAAQKSFDEALNLAEKDEFYLHYGLMLKAKGGTALARDKLRRGLRLNGPHRAEIRRVLDELEQQ